MLLTACRVREATNVPPSELDLARKVWLLPAARNKGGRDRLIPLSSQAVAVVTRAQALAGDGERVFGPISVPGLAPNMKRLVTATGAPWQTRDLRRTTATLCARLGGDPFVVSLVLGHAHPDQRMPAVMGTYLRWDYEEKVRQALDRLGEWVEDTVSRSTEPGGDVISMVR
jgi:integrase